MKRSQNDLILEVLSDGRPHSYKEIHAHAGFCRLNSRVAELRAKRGLNIVCHRGGGDYRYQLLGPLDESERLPAPSLSSSGAAQTPAYAAPIVETEDGQLALTAA